MKHSDHSRSFHAVILPTENCNFRCTYCYEDFTLGKMSDSVELSIAEFLRRKIPGLDELHVSWFGGEPLMAKETVLRLSGLIQELVEEHGVGHFYSDMSTNAYVLTPELLQSLVSNGVRKFQITLDGPRDKHNETRKQANGKATFDQIWSNIVEASKTDLEFVFLLRMHCHPGNLEDMDQLKHLLLANFGGDERFKFYFRPLSNLGGPNEGKFEVFSYEEAQERIGKLSVVPDANRYSLDVETPACYAARPDALVFRPNGQLTKCTVDLDESHNHIGVITETGDIEIDSRRLFPWLEGFLAQDDTVARCPLRSVRQAQSLVQISRAN